MKQDRKRLGIWLDHTKAHLMEPYSSSAAMETVISGYTTQERIDGEGATGSRFGETHATNNEFAKHNRQQDHLSYYYKVLADRIKNYNDVLLFGPTTAKNELYNSLNGDTHFRQIDIHLQPADKMTENQMNAFVKNFFKEKIAG